MLDFLLCVLIYTAGPYYLIFVIIYSVIDLIRSRKNKRPMKPIIKYLWLFVAVLVILLIFEKLLVYFVPSARFKLM
ncbi:MAG: hypothetical protein J6U54_21010 [Clostridiales bacterium]|nr:hypothetical protein [Clostridiales bacterium]